MGQGNRKSGGHHGTGSAEAHGFAQEFASLFCNAKSSLRRIVLKQSEYVGHLRQIFLLVSVALKIHVIFQNFHLEPSLTADGDEDFPVVIAESNIHKKVLSSRDIDTDIEKILILILILS